MSSTGNESEEKSPSSSDRLQQTGRSSNSGQRREQLTRWANLIASGSMQFPDGLSVEEANFLVSEVSLRRTRRLVHVVAVAIARSIWQDIRDMP